MNPKFEVCGVEMSKIWHCFGNYMHKADREVVINMLKETLKKTF